MYNMTFIVEGIVIKKQKLKEFDRKYTIFTKINGKIEVIAKGSNKINSKLASKLEIFTHSKFMLAHSKIKYRLCQVQNLNNFNYLRKDFKKYFIASKICYFADVFTKIQDPEPRVFFLILETFNLLKTSSNLELLLNFLIKYTKILGVDIKSKIKLKNNKLYKNFSEKEIKEIIIFLEDYLNFEFSI